MNNNQRQPNFLNKPVHKQISEVLFPHKDNDYHPHALKARPLSGLVIFLTLVKVSATLLLFFIYPNLADLSSDIKDQIINLTNQSRETNNIHILNENNSLALAADSKAQDMLLQQYFSHDTPSGKKPWKWIDKSKYDYTNAGENLAMDFSSAQSAHYALMNSETHKKNILNPKYEDIGVSVLVGEYKGKKTMLMVQMFGRENYYTKNRATALNAKKTPSKSIFTESSSSSQKIYKTVSMLSPGESSSNMYKAQINKVGISPSKKNRFASIGSITPFSKFNIMNNTQKYSNYILYTGLLFLVTLFALNIIIKIRIQRPLAIAQSFAAVIVVVILIVSKIHFAQQIKDIIIIG